MIIGSGLGALATLLERDSPSELFPGLSFPSSHDTPVLQAAYVFSFLTCVLDPPQSSGFELRDGFSGATSSPTPISTTHSPSSSSLALSHLDLPSTHNHPKKMETRHQAPDHRACQCMGQRRRWRSSLWRMGESYGRSCRAGILAKGQIVVEGRSTGLGGREERRDRKVRALREGLVSCSPRESAQV